MTSSMDFKFDYEPASDAEKKAQLQRLAVGLKVEAGFAANHTHPNGPILRVTKESMAKYNKLREAEAKDAAEMAELEASVADIMAPIEGLAQAPKDK